MDVIQFTQDPYTKIIGDFLKIIISKVLMFKIVILDIAIRLQSKYLGFI